MFIKNITFTNSFAVFHLNGTGCGYKADRFFILGYFVFNAQIKYNTLTRLIQKQAEIVKI